MQHSGAEYSFGYHCTDVIFFQIFIFFVLLKILEVGSVQFPSDYKPSRVDLQQVGWGGCYTRDSNVNSTSCIQAFSIKQNNQPTEPKETTATTAPAPQPKTEQTNKKQSKI